MAQTRPYRGITPAQRRAERREKLMDAGLELFGTIGYPRTSVRAICSAAGLNPRYFYESFDNREDLLVAVYQRVADDLFSSVREAAAGQETLEGQARATVQAAWAATTDDPRKARIIAVEVVGVSDRLERLRRETRQALAELTADNARSLAGPDLRLRLDSTLVARFLMGGVVEILLEWINGDLDASAEEVVEHFTVLFTAAGVASIAVPD